MNAVNLSGDTLISDLLKDRVAVVTGAASGIGKGIALAMSMAGAIVVAVDRQFELAEELAKQIGGRSKAFALDITDRAACDALAKTLAGRFGTVDILVNCAGIVRREPVESIEAARETWDTVMETNLTGAFNLTTALMPQLIEAKGSIINIASIQAFVAGPGLMAYSVSKSAIRALTTNLAAEFSSRGVRVNAIAPGIISTPMTQHKMNDPVYTGRFAPRVPLGIPGSPSDIAWPVIFLASEMSRYITGVTLPVDGGFLCF